MRTTGVFRAAAIVALTAACGQATGSAGATAGTAWGPDAPDDAAALTYCTDKGGTLVDRVATWNTNADAGAQVPLAGRMTFCEFESGEGDQTTRIAVELTTLPSEQPTLAAVAYLSKRIGHRRVRHLLLGERHRARRRPRSVVPLPARRQAPRDVREAVSPMTRFPRVAPGTDGAGDSSSSTTHGRSHP
jgi:hypothetical protein